MAELSATVEELASVFRELFPREHEIAFLTLTSRKQAARISELEAHQDTPGVP